MRRLGAVLFLVLFLGGSLMEARSVWSGGVKWSSGTPAAARTDAYWMPDGATPSGRLVPDVAIGGALYTTQLQSVTWSLGISGFLADLAPNTASASFVGQVTAVPGDDFVITTGLGVQWAGRVDTKSETRDVNGDYWTTVTGTDFVGALGSAQLFDTSVTSGSMEAVIEGMASTAGVSLDIVDSSSGLPTLTSGYEDPYTGSLLGYLNGAAKSSNAMAGLTRDGRVVVVMRESVTPSSVLTLTGVNAPTSWVLSTSIDVDINKWIVPNGGNNHYLAGTDAVDIATYGERVYESSMFQTTPALTHFNAWITYGGSQRPVASGDFIVSTWSQTALILLNPFQWVTESGTDWQVMSVTHTVTPQEWTVSITADNLLDLL